MNTTPSKELVSYLDRIQHPKSIEDRQLVDVYLRVRAELKECWRERGKEVELWKRKAEQAKAHLPASQFPEDLEQQL